MRTVAPPPRGEVEPTEPPSFAVVIPTFNAAATVSDAVDSALAQTKPPQEVIVVDDGSTDDLLDAVAPFGDRVTLVRQENRGVAAARNAGVRTARADFIAFLDADDRYGPRRLEVLAALGAERPDLDILTTDTLFVVDGEPRGRYYATHPFPVSDQSSAILTACFTFVCPAIRRSRLLEVGGFDAELRTGEDWDCVIRLILGGSSAGLVDEPLLEYRVHPGSLTSDRVRALWDRVRVLEKVGRTLDLGEDEQATLARSLVHHRTRATLAEAEAGIRAGGIGFRRLAALAAQPGLRPRTRVRLVTAALAPGLARKWVRRDRGSLHERFSGPG